MRPAEITLFWTIRDDWLEVSADNGFRRGFCPDLPILSRSASLPRSSLTVLLWSWVIQAPVDCRRNRAHYYKARDYHLTCGCRLNMNTRQQRPQIFLQFAADLIAEGHDTSCMRRKGSLTQQFLRSRGNAHQLPAKMSLGNPSISSVIMPA